MSIKTVFAATITLCGFIVQFIGLRGMHWSASIAQLGAIFVMVVLKAWVRRGLAEPPDYVQLTSGFELDWFATRLGDHGDGSWLDAASGSNAANSWAIKTGTSLQAHGKPHEEPSQDESVRLPEIPPSRSSGEPPAILRNGNNASDEDEDADQDEDSDEDGDSDQVGKYGQPQAVMQIRRELGRLAHWHSPASAEAVSVAKAIEVTMDSLFASSSMESFTWAIQAQFNQSVDQPVRFHVSKQSGMWKTNADVIEAALSLWLSSVYEKENQEHGHARSSRIPAKDDDTWLRTEGSLTKRNLRLLGSHTRALRRDLQWWIPLDAMAIMEVEKGDEGTLEVDTHRVVGYDPNPDAASHEGGDWIRYAIRNSSIFQSDSEDIATGGESADTLFAAESHTSLKLLYAQDMFASFVWAMAQRLKKPIKGKSGIRPIDTSNTSSWSSFTLWNDRLSALAQSIQATGLGDLEETYLSIVPALSMRERLPPADTIIELARQQAKRHEQFQHWSEAGEIYLWLFRIGKTFPEGSRIFMKATAVLMEYLRMLDQKIQLMDAQEREMRGIYEMRVLYKMTGLKARVQKELRSIGQKPLSDLGRLYKMQAREWTDPPMEEVESDQAEDAENIQEMNYPEAINLTDLHRFASGAVLSPNLNLINQRDLFDWTPLHYAVVHRDSVFIDHFLLHRADFNVVDLLGWTPLHYACKHGKLPTVQVLLRGGAETESRGRDGLVPLHCAVKEGYDSIVRSLIEAGALPDARDDSGSTPLLWAAYMGWEQVVVYLLDVTNTKLRDNQGRTALHLAAIAGEESVFRLFVEAGLDTTAKDLYRRTPLHIAAAYGHEAIVRLLIAELDVDRAAQGEDGETPLHSAAAHGHESMIRLLVLEFGADFEARNTWGRTPLSGAASEGHEDAVRALIELGADREARDQGGQTPLSWAAMIGHENVVRALIELGADREAQDQRGQTPLSWAGERGHEDVVQLLS